MHSKALRKYSLQRSFIACFLSSVATVREISRMVRYGMGIPKPRKQTVGLKFFAYLA